MMLMPYCPSAGPTGGAGVAFPAGHWSLTTAITFLAILLSLDFLDLVEVELDRRVPAEDRDQHLHLLLVRVDLFDGAVEVGERAGVHADHVALAPGGRHPHPAALERLEDV